MEGVDKLYELLNLSLGSLKPLDIFYISSSSIRSKLICETLIHSHLKSLIEHTCEPGNLDGVQQKTAQQHGLQARAVLWMCSVAGNKAVKECGITSGDIFFSMPNPSLKEINTVVEAGFTDFTYPQLVAAGLSSTPGLELWVSALKQLDIPPDIPPLAGAVCSGQVASIPGLLQNLSRAERSQQLPDALHLAANMHSPDVVMALLDAMYSEACFSSTVSDLEPQQMQQLLATAVLRGHAALVRKLSCSYDSCDLLSNIENFAIGLGNRRQAKIAAAAVAELMQSALQHGHDSCIAGLCQLRGAQELDPSSVACLLLETLDSRAHHGKTPAWGEVASLSDAESSDDSSTECAAGWGSDAFWALCSLPAATQMNWGAVGSLLRIAVQHREAAAACCLCQLPPARHMDPQSRSKVLRLGMAAGCSRIVQQFLVVLPIAD